MVPPQSLIPDVNLTANERLRNYDKARTYHYVPRTAAAVTLKIQGFSLGDGQYGGPQKPDKFNLALSSLLRKNEPHPRGSKISIREL
jgi:hypothetical protein